MPLPNMLPVTGGLPCEPDCRRQPWGRRDCHRHLECLRTLTAGQVLARLREHVPALCGAPAPRGPLPAGDAAPAPARDPPPERHDRPPPMNEPLSLAYYGYVSDLSGYGHAARATSTPCIARACSFP